MAHLMFPPPVHKIFLHYIFLNEIRQHPDGISGYRLRKVINKVLMKNLEAENAQPHAGVSQSLVYREFKEFKAEGLLDENKIVIKNRNQILYTINTKGEKRLEKLKRIMREIAPIPMEPGKLVEDVFAGKIPLVDLLPKHVPKEELLKSLKEMRQQIEKALANIDRKIKELESGQTSKSSR